MGDHSLDEERRAAADVIGELGIGLPWWWEEDGLASPLPSEEVCIGIARTSDALLLIVADCLTEITRREYLAALEYGTPCFIFLKQGIPRDRDTDTFVTQERRRSSTAYFGTPAELRTAITNAITNHVAFSWRVSILAGADHSYARGTSASAAPSGLSTEVSLEDLLVESAEHMSTMNPSEAAVVIIKLVEHGLEAESPGRLKQVLNRLGKSVQRNRLSETELAWLLNAEGLLESELGRLDLAKQRFEQMKDLGEHEGNSEIVGVAIQNLGVVAIKEGDELLAERLTHSVRDQRLADLDDYTAIQLRLNLANVALERGDLEAVESTLNEVEPMARKRAFHHLIAAINGTRGIVASERGDLELAEKLLQRSLRSARRRGSRRDELIALQSLAAAAGRNGELMRARARYKRAIEVAGEAGASQRAVTLHTSFASLCIKSSLLGEAETLFLRAAGMAKDIGNIRGEAQALADLGAVKLMRGDGEAERVLASALPALIAQGDSAWQGRVLANLAGAKWMRGDIASARQLMEQSLVVADEPDDVARRHKELINLYLESPVDVEAATRHLDVYLALITGNMTESQLAWENGLGASQLDRAGLEEVALAYYERGLALARQARDQATEFHLTNDLANVLARLGRPDESILALQNCLAIALERTDRVMEEMARYNLGETYRRAGDLDEALEQSRRALGLAHSLEDSELVSDAETNLGTLLVDRQEYESATGAFQRAIETAREIGAWSTVARAQAGLGNVSYLTGDFPRAVELYESSSEHFMRADSPDQAISSRGAALDARVGAESLSDPLVQDFVTTAQELGQDGQASESLARVAGALYERGRQSEATEIWAVSILLAGVARDRSSAAEFSSIEGLLQGVVRFEVFLASLGQEAASLREEVRRKLEDEHQIGGDAAGRLWDLAFEAVSQNQTSGSTSTEGVRRDRVDAFE